MLFVRLKQCEVALNAGRLDEAFELLRSADLRSHRSGQDLLDRLARALIERGRTHLAAAQFEAAAQDCERAARLAGLVPDVVALRTAISDAMAERRRADQRRDQLAAAVRRHMGQGQLTLGGQLLAAAPAEERFQGMERELADLRATVQSVSKKVGAALDAGDWQSALDLLSRLDRQVIRHPDVRQLCTRVTELIVAQASKAIQAGNLDEAGALLDRHRGLPGRFIETDRLREALRQCREAGACIERADAAGAERLLRVLSGQWPDASWMTASLAHVQQLRALVEAVLAGPLGAHRAAAIPGQPDRADRIGPETSDRFDFLLHVDGAGGFRVIGAPSVTLGPATANHRVDVAIVGDAGIPQITITRSDEDYFVQSNQPIEVNDKPTSHALLANGDRIAIGPRCRIRFRRPNPASTTAILDVISGRLARGDVRQVILFDREMILGPGPAAHIRVDSLSGPAVLQRRGEGMFCRAADPVRVDGRPAGAELLITAGAHITIGTVGLVLLREGEVGR